MVQYIKGIGQEGKRDLKCHFVTFDFLVLPRSFIGYCGL
jgi:hypothetical protein